MKKPSKLSKAAAGAMFLIACGKEGVPPEAAKNVTQEQYDIIEADLERAELQTGFVKELLDRADPLPDLKSGKKMENNDHVKDLIDSGLSDGRWYLENDHFLIADPAKINNEDLDELAPGFRTEKDITDNYLVILHDPAEGDFASRETGVYMHELGRFYYPIDNVLVGEGVLAKYDEQIGDVFRDLYYFDDVGSYSNPMWLPEFGISNVRSMYEHAQDQDWIEEMRSNWESEQSAENTDSSFEDFLSAEIEHSVRGHYERITRFLDMTDSEVIEYQLADAGTVYTPSDVMKTFKLVGITEEEVFDALRASPELFEIDRDQIKEWQDEAKNLFPEINFEIREGEDVRESDSETTLDVQEAKEAAPTPEQQEGRWQGKRM